MSDSWILDSLRDAEREAIARSIALHREANSEHHRAMLLHKAAEQLENSQETIEDVIHPLQHDFAR